MHEEIKLVSETFPRRQVWWASLINSPKHVELMSFLYKLFKIWGGGIFSSRLYEVSIILMLKQTRKENYKPISMMNKPEKSSTKYKPSKFNNRLKGSSILLSTSNEWQKNWHFKIKILIRNDKIAVCYCGCYNWQWVHQEGNRI